MSKLNKLAQNSMIPTSGFVLWRGCCRGSR